MQNNFVEKNGAWVYVGDTRDYDQTTNDFIAMLEDFPEPTYKWLDERLPYENPGPGTWTLELQNDQSTHFVFNVANLSFNDLDALATELESIVTTDHKMYGLGGEAFVDRVWQVTSLFAEVSSEDVIQLSYRIYWRVSN